MPSELQDLSRGLLSLRWFLDEANDLLPTELAKLHCPNNVELFAELRRLSPEQFGALQRCMNQLAATEGCRFFGPLTPGELTRFVKFVRTAVPE
jgi:hypothetical protein